MGRVLIIVVAVWCVGERSARAVELRSELSIGREFVYLTNGVETEVFDGQLGLGAGLTMVSDYTIERYGATALVEYRGAHFSTGVAATFGPRQERRGWASLDPHAELQVERGAWSTRVAAGGLLRRIEGAGHVRSVAVR